MQAQPHDADPQLRITHALYRFIEGPYASNIALFQPSLTARQREVLNAVIVTGSYKAAADVLGISSDTVKNHLQRDERYGAYRKLGASTLHEAMLVATARGEIHLPDLIDEIGIDLGKFRLLDSIQRAIILKSVARRGEDSHAAIGIHLGLSEGDIKNKFGDISRTLGVETKAQAMLAAFSFMCTAEFVAYPLQIPPTLQRFSFTSEQI